jgi:hypothetical protein
VLEIPLPVALVSPKAGSPTRVHKKKSSRAKTSRSADGKLKSACPAEKNISPIRNYCNAVNQPARVDGMPALEPWAGPTYVSSPPPSSLPVPSKLLLGALKSTEARRVLSFPAEESQAQDMIPHYPFSAAAAQADLKRLLRVA